MNSFLFRHLLLPCPSKLTPPTTLRHLTTTVSSLTKDIATQLSNSTTLQQLNRLYAHIITTRFLDFNAASVHWNNIIRSYTRLGASAEALQVYLSMSRAGVLPDSYTIPIVLKAASQFFDIRIARQLHSVSIKCGLEFKEFCESGFISIYCKFGELDDGYKMFDENPERKLGSWNAIVGGFSQCGHASEAIKMFVEMRKCGFRPDHVTMVSVIPACGSLGDIYLALQLHKYVFYAMSCGKPDTLMMNSLIDVYGKFGRMELARRVFLRMDKKNVSSWTSMIVGYGSHGHVNEAIEYFHQMREAGVRPNHVTFLSLLRACVHGGKVQEGSEYFNMMTDVYGIMPQLKHYGCMVDLFGRVGLLEEARKIVEGMPMEPNVVIWGCLMGACEKYEDVEMAEWVAKQMVKLDPWNDGVYVVLSNIYASKGMWKHVERIRVVMKQQKLDKVRAYSLTRNSI